MPRAAPAEQERQAFLNWLRSALGKAPLYPWPVVPGRRCVVWSGRASARYATPGRIAAHGKKPDWFLVELEAVGLREVQRERITLVTEL